MNNKQSTKDLIWNSIRRYLRIRHELKVKFGSLITIDRGQLPDSRYAEQLFLFGEKEILTLPPAGQFADTKNEMIERMSAGRFSTYKPFVCSIRDAHLVGSYAVAITSDRKILTENLYGTQHTVLALNPYKFITWSFKKTEQYYDIVFSINNPYAHNFCIWFNDCLPCLYAYEIYRENTNEQPKLLVPGFLFEWQKRSLQLMGYSEKDYIPYNYNHLRVKKLVIPSYPKFDREDLPVAPSLLLWLRERLLSSINVNKSNKKPYVFISRKDSSKQARIANESEISQALSIYDFDTVVLGELELDQQIALFANAKIIVATHGAGLTNLMYSTNPKVIEIFPPGSFRKTFYALTHVVKGSYMAIVAQKRNENGAWCVDINQLLGAIKQLMSKE